MLNKLFHRTTGFCQHLLARRCLHPGHYSQHRDTCPTDQPISLFSCLQTITTNQGHQFESHLFQFLARLCGIQLSQMATRHPMAKGLVECFHWTLLGICTAFKEDLQTSVAELVYGEPLKIPSELLTPTADPMNPVHLITKFHQHDMAHLRPFLAACHAFLAAFMHSDLDNCAHTFICQPQCAGFWSPPTVAYARSCHRERRHCHSSCVGGLSWCQLTGSSRPASSMGLTAGATPSTCQSVQP
ncbi:hypothetical protein B7P43_G04936 [Cryptotermes secundus]|uniref:Integrase catalytic domain-containing protein n=1 Tax=Cryptotermes secundus TaxID=105785 RepID=A0A2J7Q0U4_9NEOP|nr:hypothetical protein B7P43_G04936 [Cryptotermes secundus]